MSAVCDFCGGPGPRWVLVAPGSFTEDEDWLACRLCWPFIRDGDRDGLKARAVETHVAALGTDFDGVSPEVVRQAMDEGVSVTHAAFWLGYRGGGRFLPERG